MSSASYVPSPAAVAAGAAEEWRPAPGYEGRYEVSNAGCVRSRVGRSVRVLQPTLNGVGYPTVRLYLGGKAKTHTVHSLVASAFLPPPPGPVGLRAGGYAVDHRNNQKADNRAENLEWVTQAENLRRATADGLRPRGTDSHNAALTEEDVLEMRRLAAEGVSSHRIARQFGVSQSCAYRAINGKSYRTVGAEGSLGLGSRVGGVLPLARAHAQETAEVRA
jgi:hypothetical protein